MDESLDRVLSQLKIFEINTDIIMGRQAGVEPVNTVHNLANEPAIIP